MHAGTGRLGSEYDSSSRGSLTLTPETERLSVKRASISDAGEAPLGWVTA